MASAIPLDAGRLDAREASRALAGLKSVLIVHLKLQDGMLYPWMTHQPSAELRENATRFREMMRTLMVSFLEFYQRWSRSDAIAADPDGFVAAWRLVSGVIKHRLDAEARELYRSIDAYACSPSNLIAS
ncbi:MAG: hypothetical protein JO199_05875 [Candidatus Eremiobacteraeota bacterium]|nr:hypothetical protein [Candidatus Eremiobacteraeota bacterium]